jgi:hypothetical protein
VTAAAAASASAAAPTNSTLAPAISNEMRSWLMGIGKFSSPLGGNSGSVTRVAPVLAVKTAKTVAVKTAKTVALNSGQLAVMCEESKRYVLCVCEA